MKTYKRIPAIMFSLGFLLGANLGYAYAEESIAQEIGTFSPAHIHDRVEKWKQLKEKDPQRTT